MQNNSESLIRLVYRKWKALRQVESTTHPDEEVLACFLEGKLVDKERNNVQTHLFACERCAEIVAVGLKVQSDALDDIPEQVLTQAKGLMSTENKESLLEIFLRLKERTLEVVKVTGDILMGQELIPAPVLRSRNIRDFKDEITVLKDFNDIRMQVRVESKREGSFSLYITVSEKTTQKAIKDLRITLLKGEVELESYVAESGKVCFENVAVGNYTIAINDIEQSIASVLVDVRI